jgi:PAS domain S-box-containing protein
MPPDPPTAHPADAPAVLLVDDHAANLLALEAVLAAPGLDLIRAYSGEEALRRLGDRDFAAVLLDLDMPGLNGFETARRIRDRDRSRETPIIFVTAALDTHFPVAEAYRLGAVDYLVKPLVPDILRAKVAVFVDLFRKAERVRELERGQRLRAERALRHAEGQLRLIFESATDYAIFSTDTGDVVTTWNAGAERVFGWSEAEIVGRSADVLFTPEDRAAGVPARELARAAETGRAEDDRWHVRKDGTRFFASGVVTPIRDGVVQGFTKVARDATTRKLAEEQLLAQLRLTAVLASATDFEAAARELVGPVWQLLGFEAGGMWVPDEGAGVLRWVHGWHAPGVEADEFEAASRSAVFRPGEGLPGRVWRDGGPAWVTDLAADGNFPRSAPARAAGLHTGVCFPVASGGRVLGVMEFFSRSRREPDGGLLALMGVIGGQIGQFVERVRARDELRTSEERFARFMWHLPGLAWIKDLRGRYVYANDAAGKAFGVPPANLYGKTDEEVFPPETAALFRENDRMALAGGVRVIEALAHPDGSVHHSLVSKFPIPGPDGEPILIGGMAIDVTDRVRAEEALREADRRKDEFLATLAHELRNPLAPIRNALEVMRLAGGVRAVGEALPPSIHQAREVMERQVVQLVRLIDDLLDVSRITRGKIELRRERLDLSVAVRAAVEASQPLVQAARHELSVELPPDPVWVDADPARLAQVVTNLLNNAAKYTDPGGRIRVTVGPEAGEAVVRVRDTGVGIPPGMLAAVFELFTQVDTSPGRRSQSGLGIGLSLAKRLVEMHGGSVGARSEGPGRGSEFVVWLPLTGPAPAAR